MTGFSADWLALREPADAAARDPGLVARLGDWGAGRPLRIVDLGCGTGATWRSLAPRLPGAEWLLVDHDPALLADAARRTGAATRCADLAADLEAVVAGADLVTASALLDLCSAAWLDRLAAALPAQAALYVALSYDGEETWAPAHPLEAEALAAFHAHQRGDKGLGPSLGPAASAHLAARLAAAGREAHRAASPWRLAAPDPLIPALADGAAAAVAETGALAAPDLAAWYAARRAARRVVIGHEDLLVLL